MLQRTNMSHTEQHNNVSYKSDDGDEGDVSSDDSLRLKLSDDENTEAVDNSTNNLQTPKREDQRNTENRSSKSKPSKKHSTKVIAINDTRKNHISSSKSLSVTKHCIRIKRTVKFNMHSDGNSGRWSSSFSSRNYNNYHSNRSSNGRPYFKHKSRYHKQRGGFYNNYRYSTPKKSRRENFADDDMGHNNQFTVDRGHNEEKYESRINMKEEEKDVKHSGMSVETDPDTHSDLKCEKEIDRAIKQDVSLSPSGTKEKTNQDEPYESTKVKPKEENEENGKCNVAESVRDAENKMKKNVTDSDEKMKCVDENDKKISLSDHVLHMSDTSDKFVINEEEGAGCDKQVEDVEIAAQKHDSTVETASSDSKSVLPSGEALTNGDNDDTIEEISIDISSDNESDHVSNFVESSQDCTNEDSSNDRFQSEEAVDGKGKGPVQFNNQVVTNGNSDDNNYADEEQTADASDSNEEEQHNTESNETLMDQNQDKRDEGHMIEEVDIEESNENLYGSAGVNITEEVEKTQLNTNDELTLREELTSSPSSLKRSSNIIDGDCSQKAKKAKVDVKCAEEFDGKPSSAEKKSTYLQQLQDLFENKQKLSQMTQEGLVDLLMQKCAEAITMNSEIGKLKQQLQINEKNQEAMKARCQQLTKQLKDFEMVLKRNELDRKSSGDKYVAPIKINRSVGLQVTLLSDQGIQTLRQVQGGKSAGANSTRQNQQRLNSSGLRRVKVNSPRRVASTTSSITISTQSPQTVAVAKSVNLTATTTALVVSKSTELPQVSRTATLPSNAVRTTTATNNQTSPKIHLPQKHVVINGITSPSNRAQIATLSVQKNQPIAKSNDLIDLTDEEDKKKTPSRGPTILTQAIAQPTVISDAIMKHNNTVQHSQTVNSPRYQRVIQTISGSIINQPNNIRVVQPANQLTSTNLVNNNPPRLTYIMPTGPGQGRQVVITSSNQIRPVNANMKNQYSTVTYKTNVANVTAVTGIQNGTVTRILPAQANVQISRHPAPLPATPPYEINPSWKLPPPAPSLKITKMTTGIVLSWTLSLTDRYEEIASYQLFAYQEISGVAPSTDMWKKVGDVRALPLPMACTLTQFSPGNNYYFAVRAVDTHSRYGQYSQPGNISL